MAVPSTRLSPRDFLPFLPFPFSQDCIDAPVELREAIRRFPPLAVRRIVTKGFAVILDLICMLMVMDVYLRSYSPGFVAACYLLSRVVFARAATRGSHERVCRCRLMPYQVMPHLSFKSIALDMPARLDVDKTSIDYSVSKQMLPLKGRT